jgi:F-type H+-transporting ATPase subunit alpha
VSRVGGNAQVTPMRKVAGRLKIELSQYRDLEAFSQFGSELDPETQRTLARGERLVKTLNQDERSPMPVADQVVQVFAGTNGYLDRVAVDKVDEFLEGLTQRFHAEHADLRDKIAGGDWSEETVKAVDAAVKEYADDFGYDLDEEGHPMDEGESERVVERGAAAEDREGGEDTGAGEREEETETAAV